MFCTIFPRKHLGSFKTVSSTVNSSLRDSLTKILTPKKPINILRDVKDCQSKGIPYTMVFCGKFHLFDLIFFFLLFLKESTEVQKYFFFLFFNHFFHYFFFPSWKEYHFVKSLCLVKTTKP